MYTIFKNDINFNFRSKMAGFDYDWTLVRPKNELSFPKDENDWDWLYTKIPSVLEQLYKNGYMIVLFTNQSKKWKHDHIKNAIKELKFPILVVIATDKKGYKPNIDMFDVIKKDIFKKQDIDKDNSFFVGDALGRKTDHSDCDRVFAENIGIKYYSPEEYFKPYDNISIPDILVPDGPEVIIMTGYPGSGKSSIAKNICEKNNNRTRKYYHIEKDVFSTVSKMKKEALKYMNGTTICHSVIFDGTFSSKKNRKDIIDFVKNFNATVAIPYQIRCVYVNTSYHEAYNRNMCRSEDKQVPKIAFNVYKKYFEKPDSSEGFIVIDINN
jgi:bifunctional polynucleotide phosphatase/kinase